MKHKLESLNNPYFICSLFILLANDFYLKYTYHNWTTGKLSDVAGLFVFVYFWTTIFPSSRKLIYITSGLLFVYWKSIYSQPLIDFFSKNFYAIDRTVDPGDLLALLVLPLTYYFYPTSRIPSRITSVTLALLTVFAFCATSRINPVETFDQPAYILFKRADLKNATLYPNEVRIFDLDSMKVASIDGIQVEAWPVLHDGFYKAEVLAELDLHLLRAAEEYNGSKDLGAYRSLRDSLAFSGITMVTVDLDTVKDHLIFRGTKLDGVFKRSSNESKLVIEGRYKAGVPDSVWNYYDRSNELTLRKHYVRGELVTTERPQNKDLIITHVTTRQDTITKRLIILAAITCGLLAIAFRLIWNFRSCEKREVSKMSTFSKVVQALLLPTIIFFAAKLISEDVFGLEYEIGQIFFNFSLTNILIIPFLVFGFNKSIFRTRFDLILYILLFILLIVWFDNMFYLKAIFV